MFTMAKLLQGKTIEDVNTFIKEQGVEGRPPTWAKTVKIAVFAKKGKAETAKPLDLAPGTYAILCFITDKETKKSHAELGMTMELTVE